MYNMENFILDTALVIGTIWIVNRFWNVFFEKKNSKVFIFTLYLIYGLYQFLVRYNRGDINIGITAINILFVFIIGVCGYENAGKKKYFLLVLFYAVWSLIEVFVYFFIKIFLIPNVRFEILGEVISKILMILIVYILPIIWNKKENDFIPTKFYFFLLLIPIGSIYIAINEFYSKVNTILSLITISIMLLFNVVIFDIYIKLYEIFIYEKEKVVHVQLLNMVSKNTNAQKNMMEDFNREKHNLINEVIALKNSVENSDRETVLRNLNRIIKNCNSSEIISTSGNSTIDSIINFKYAVAKECGIDFHIKIYVPNELPIVQCDIGIVLGNALDNAIESTKECKMNHKIIDISMGIKKEALVIVIKNPYEHVLRGDRNGNYLSTKREKNHHGYGLISINKVVEKYHGMVIKATENSIFTLTIIMNFREL